VQYAGDAAQVLYDYITRHNRPGVYILSLTIMQSSGMGKSRMIDELSKAHFVIPLNLREGISGHSFFLLGCLPSDRRFSGYPAPDSEVRDWLNKTTSADGDSLLTAFLTALFEKTREAIENLNDPDWFEKQILNGPDLPEGEAAADALPAKFRLFMTAGQQFWRQGDLRVNFYQGVLRRAETVGL
jgi:hypothetical protein